MSEAAFHPIDATQTYAEVVLPMALPQNYIYQIPEEWIAQASFGKRVEVQFGKNRIYAGLIVRISNEAPGGYQPKAIQSVIDSSPIINAQQYKLWTWMAQYYCCTMGEIMNAALPANLKLSSETRVSISPVFDQDYTNLDDKEYLIAEVLTIQEELRIADIQGI